MNLTSLKTRMMGLYRGEDRVILANLIRLVTDRETDRIAVAIER